MQSYHHIKYEIEELYEKRQCPRIRSKCLWYEEGEKASNFFLNQEKRSGIQSQTKLIVDDQEITSQNMIQNELLFFYETFFRNTSANTSEGCERLLNKFLFSN